MSTPLLLSIDETAEALGLGRSKTCELIYAGTVPSVKVGRRRLVPASALPGVVEALLEASAS